MPPMEKFIQRENVYLGFENSPKTPNSEHVDFNDVFGGPPRRFSMQEVRERYSFGEGVESEEENASSLWKEKSVFGEETTPGRRHHQGDQFFDDIFKGAQSYTSPGRADRDTVFGSNSGSRIVSPLLGTSLPQFSLPSKLSKAMELPTFGSHNNSQYKLDSSTNSPHSSSPLSKLSSQAIWRHEYDDQMRDEVDPLPSVSPLSYESCLMSDDRPSHQKDNSENLKKDNIFNQFHFSIYKWAGRGVPMLMPLNHFKSKDNRKYDKCASSNGRMESRSWSNFSKPESLRARHVDQDLRSPNDSVVLDGVRESHVKEVQVKSLDESGFREKIEEEVPENKAESLYSELKMPLHAFRNKGDHPEMKDKKPKTPGIHGDVDDRKNVKEKEGIEINSNNGKVKRSSFNNIGVSDKKNAVKGKVKEFVQIFNQEADSRPKADDVQRSRSCRWRNNGDNEQKENEVSSKAAKYEEQADMHNVDKKPDVSFKVDENPNNEEAQQYSPTNTSHQSPTHPKNTFSSEMLHADSKISAENSDDALEDNFMVQELFDAHENDIKSECSEDTKAIDAKIWQWSFGKKGNIRSLLSTLQYVLWAESGWKAVPLVDLIEANSVKRAYQKALLRLHPDKLQQKGAVFHHKYTAEKVFDILQEAWDHFNTSSLTL